jgi:DNA recombination protein RmuC
MNQSLAFMIGVLVGAVLVLIFWLIFRRREQQFARNLISSAEERQLEQFNQAVGELRAAFDGVAREALTTNSEVFLSLAKTRLEQQTTTHTEQLESRRKLIDQQFDTLTKRLGEISTGFRTLEEQRREQYGSLTTHLEQARRVTTELQTTTAALRAALANPQRRGQWGERIAEDVLRFGWVCRGCQLYQAGSHRGSETPGLHLSIAQQSARTHGCEIPSRAVFEDARSPDEATAATHRTQFLRDIRNRFREVTERNYIDPAAGTVDYVLVFIPNEQIYSFMHEHDPALMDDALKQKVVLCSPLTLYAVLAVMRQVAERFRLQESSREILALLASFRKQWAKYSDVVDKLGRALESVNKTFGELTATRTRQLERELDKIEELQKSSDE